MSQEITPTPIGNSTLEQFVETNLRKLLTFVAVLAAALAAYGLASHSKRKSFEDAGAAFVRAKSVEDLDVLIAQSKGSIAAGNALLKKAELLWQQNKKSTSVDSLREFAKSYPDHPLLAEALIALGTKQESLAQRDEAKQVFERVAREFPKSELAALADLRLGDLAMAQGNEEEARKIFEGMPAKHAANGAQNPFLPQAEARLEWLAAKLPTKEVDGPPKPKEPAKPASGNLGPAKPLTPTLLPNASSGPGIDLSPKAAAKSPAAGPAPAAPAKTATAPAAPPAPAAPAKAK